MCQTVDKAPVFRNARRGFRYVICNQAGVNRSTFYLHYETIGDLLAETVEATNKDFLSYFTQSSEGFIEKIATRPLNELMLVTPEFLTPYLRFVEEHKPVFHAAFVHPTAMRSEDKFHSLYQFIFDPILERFSVPPGKRKYMVQFYLQGIMAIIQSWVIGGCREEIPEIVEIITFSAEDFNAYSEQFKLMSASLQNADAAESTQNADATNAAQNTDANED